MERVTSTNVIPQAELEKEAGRTVEMQDMQEKNFGSQRDSEEYTFKWQEKVFSKVIVSPVRSTYGGYYGLVVVTPPRPQILHRSHDNLKNPYRIASIFYM